MSDPTEPTTATPASTPTARRGVVLVNPAAGSGRVDVDELRTLFEGYDVEECAADEIAARAAVLRNRHPAFIGVSGGDGTLRGVAEHLVGFDVPLLAIPGGTRNHFAKDLGITSLEIAAATARDGHERRVDVGRVDGRVFLNNSSLGVYPRIVIERELHEHRMRKPVAMAVAIWRQIRKGRRFGVEVDGERLAAWLVFVGNGRYGEGLVDLADREALDDGLLDVRVVRADHPYARVRLVGALLLGRLARSPIVVRRPCPAVTVDLVRRRVGEVALDGEVERIHLPLRYECDALALRVLVPRPKDDGDSSE